MDPWFFVGLFAIGVVAFLALKDTGAFYPLIPVSASRYSDSEVYWYQGTQN